MRDSPGWSAAAGIRAQLAVVRSARTILLRALAVVFVGSFVGGLLVLALGAQDIFLALLLDSALVSIFCLPGLFRAILRPATELAAEQAAAGAEARFNTIAQAVNDGIVIFDMGKTIRFANRAAERIHGYEAGAMLGMNMEALVPEDWRERFRTAMAQRLDPRTAEIIGQGLREVEGLRRNGERFSLEVRVNAVQQGASIAFVVVQREITARKQAEEALRASEQKFRSLLESLPVAVRIVQDVRLAFANQADARLHGYDAPEEEYDLAPRSQIAQADHSRVQEYDMRRDAGQEAPQRYEIRRLRRDGTEFPAGVEVVRMNYQGAPASLMAIRDLSATKRIEMFEKLLPVCCVCGKIRDDTGAKLGAGAWERLDQYLCKHSDTQFTHTFCPDCFVEYKKQNEIR